MLDAEGTQRHRRRETDRENDRLSGIEHCKGHVSLYARVLVARHRTVVSPRLALLGGKIFDGFIIQQRIDGLGIGIAVAVIHLAANVDAPLSRVISEQHVNGDGGSGHGHVAPVEMQEQHRDDEDEFDNRRCELKQHHTHNRLDRVAAAFENAR